MSTCMCFYTTMNDTEEVRQEAIQDGYVAISCLNFVLG